jgi:cytochrome P450
MREATGVRDHDTTETDPDPFASKDRFFGVGVVDDPYPRWAELQSQCPVHHGSVSGQFGMTGPDNLLFPDETYWSAYTYDAVDDVLRRSEAFSSSWYHNSLGEVIGRTILEMDPPEHHRFRMLLQPAFTKREMDAWEQRFIRDIVNRYIDRFAAVGKADLSTDFAFHYPIEVTAVAAGLPVSDLAAFYRHTALLTNIAVSREERGRASADLGAMVQKLIEVRRHDPQKDLISILTQATFEEAEDARRRKLSDDEIVSFMRLLVPAGAQTTYRAMTTLLFGLLMHLDQLDAVRQDRSLIPRAVEEAVRWEVPLTATGRDIVVDTEIAGQPVPAGCHVGVALGAANRDPSRWEDPHEFDIHRPSRPHLGFGSGPHLCLGIHLARTELRVALECLLDRLADLRLDPDAPAPSISGLGARTAAHLPVVFTPQGDPSR